jgi:hypothetical protein
MRNLDDDYRSWREDRYKKFSDEFSKWRSSRSASGGAGSPQPTSEPSSTGTKTK